MNHRSRFIRSALLISMIPFLLSLACKAGSSLPTNVPAIPAAVEIGTRRDHPIPMNTLVSIPGWDIKVLEFLRGEDALTIINSGNWKADPLSEGQEYALAKVFIRNTSFDRNYHSLGSSDLFMTGSSSVGYPDKMDSWPQPEFLFEDMYTAEAVEGWIDAVIPTDEHDLMLVVDVKQNDTRTTHYLALEDGASLSLAAEMAGIKPNALGLNSTDPATFGQQVISSNWEITALDSIGGQEAETILGKDNPNYAPPGDGLEHLLLQVKLRYINPDEQPAWIGPDAFYSVDNTGSRISGEWIYLPPQPDRAWLSGLVLPGAELEGWVALTVPAGADRPVIAFYPQTYPSGTAEQDLRYLAAK